MKTRFTPLILLLTLTYAHAADYFVVAPATYRASAAQPDTPPDVPEPEPEVITVGLVPTTFAKAKVGTAFSYDMSTLLSVTGDAAFDSNQVSWSVIQGTLPLGLTLQANGSLAGTPTTEGIYSFSLAATYKGQSGPQNYSMEVENPYQGVVLLMHFDNIGDVPAQGDVAAGVVTWLGVDGSPVVASDQSRFGGGSLKLDGRSRLKINGDMAFGTGDFTIEGWARKSADNRDNGVLGTLGNHTNFFIRGNEAAWGGSYDVFFAGGNLADIPASNWPLNTWVHFALTRSAGMVRVFANGVMVREAVNGSNFGIPTLTIGSDGYDLNAGLIGHIDEIRITKGVARYTAPFTPPSSAF